MKLIQSSLAAVMLSDSLRPDSLRPDWGREQTADRLLRLIRHGSLRLGNLVDLRNTFRAAFCRPIAIPCQMSGGDPTAVMRVVELRESQPPTE